MNQEVPVSIWRRCLGLGPDDVRNQLQFAGATLAWALIFVGCTFLLKREIMPAGPARWLIAAVPTLAGLGLFVVFSRFLKKADEFQRLIQLQGLGLAFGGTFLAITGYPLFVRLGAPEMALSEVGTLMLVLYAAGTVFGAWRYR